MALWLGMVYYGILDVLLNLGDGLESYVVDVKELTCHTCLDTQEAENAQRTVLPTWLTLLNLQPG